MIAEAWTSERADARYLVHAELKALLAADAMGLTRSERRRCVLYTTLEPCMMCLGAAISAQVGAVVYALESPGDGASALAVDRPGLPAVFRPPPVRGGLGRAASRALFARYAASAPPGGLRDWALSLTVTA